MGASETNSVAYAYSYVQPGTLTKSCELEAKSALSVCILLNLKQPVVSNID